jgi:hypothetical protein
MVGKSGIYSATDMKSIYQEVLNKFPSSAFFVFSFIDSYIFFAKLFEVIQASGSSEVLQFASSSQNSYAVAAHSLKVFVDFCDVFQPPRRFLVDDLEWVMNCTQQIKVKPKSYSCPSSSEYFHMNPVNNQHPPSLDNDPILISRIPEHILKHIHSDIYRIGYRVESIKFCDMQDRNFDQLSLPSVSSSISLTGLVSGFAYIQRNQSFSGLHNFQKGRILREGLVLGTFSDSVDSFSTLSKFPLFAHRSGLRFCQSRHSTNLIAYALPYSPFLSAFLRQAYDHTLGQTFLNFSTLIQMVRRIVFTPKFSLVKHRTPRIVIVVPLRDRKLHFDVFKTYLKGKLNGVPHAVVGVEQTDKFLFNRGWLINVGMQFSFQHSSLQSAELFVAHDVDMLADSYVDYLKFEPHVSHLANKASQFGYQMPYADYLSGIVVFTRQTFTSINGYSNLFFGWGGEDDDLARRIHARGLKISRPNSSGKILSLSDAHTHRDKTNHAQNVHLLTKAINPNDGFANCLHPSLGSIIKIHQDGSDFSLEARMATDKL